MWVVQCVSVTPQKGHTRGRPGLLRALATVHAAPSTVTFSLSSLLTYHPWDLISTPQLCLPCFCSGH